MNYTIEKVKLDKNHPFWGGQQIYKLLNIYTRQYSLGHYTTIEAANWALSKKQERLSISY